MKYARIENGKVVETIPFNPTGCFTEDIVNQFVECPEDTEQNDLYGNGVFTKPLQNIETDERQEILNKLAKLDIEVPRILEDIIEQGNFNIHPSKMAVINEKIQLRQQLNNLE